MERDRGHRPLLAARLLPALIRGWELLAGPAGPAAEGLGDPQAFRIFTERAIEWLPSGHTFLAEPQSVTMEPWPGGRFYERAADGTEAIRGTVLAWSPPGRLVVTWRIGPGWRPLPDDERASQIEAEFTAAGPDQTEVTLTYRQLHRLGEFGQQVWQAVASASPGESLQRYAGAVARHRG